MDVKMCDWKDCPELAIASVELTDQAAVWAGVNYDACEEHLRLALVDWEGQWEDQINEPLVTPAPSDTARS